MDSIYGPDTQLPFVHDRFCFIEARQDTQVDFRKKTQETPLSKMIQSIKVDVVVNVVVDVIVNLIVIYTII